MTHTLGSPALVVTSINSPNNVLNMLADGTIAAGWRFLVIGDSTSPADFDLTGCEFFSLDDQLSTDLEFARSCPTHHYARKNIGYLLAAQGGASVIVETDDDNRPSDEFFILGERSVKAPSVAGVGWVNVYRYFTEHNIWPRGLPLDMVQSPVPDPESPTLIDAPIQQGLADANPDVDAIYRLIFPLPIHFEPNRSVGLGPRSWCPFNSQNTVWWSDAWVLMYLPAYCSFRMTDIWRSFVAQRIAWANGWSVLFTSPTVTQQRNGHDLNRDFRDEIPGYTQNARIAQLLDAVDCEPGVSNIPENMRRCYRVLANEGIVGDAEPALLDLWLSDLGRVMADSETNRSLAGAF